MVFKPDTGYLEEAAIAQMCLGNRIAEDINDFSAGKFKGSEDVVVIEDALYVVDADGAGRNVVVNANTTAINKSYIGIHSFANNVRKEIAKRRFPAAHKRFNSFKRIHSPANFLQGIASRLLYNGIRKLLL